MPTTNPRLNVTLSREAKLRLTKLRKVSGHPESRWVSMFVDASIPVMDALIESLSVVKSNPAQAAAVMEALMKGAITEARQEQKEMRLAVRKATSD